MELRVVAWRLRCGGRQWLALAYLLASSVSEERRQPNRGAAFWHFSAGGVSSLRSSKRASLPAWSFDIVNPLSLFSAFRRETSVDGVSVIWTTGCVWPTSSWPRESGLYIVHPMVVLR